MKTRIAFVLFLIPLVTSIACAGLSQAVSGTLPGKQVSPAPIVSATAPPTQIPATPDSQIGSPPELQPAADQLATPSVASGLSGDLILDQSTLENVYQKVNPSVVNIQVIEQANLLGGRRRSRGSGPAIALGTGFVWDTSLLKVADNLVIGLMTMDSVSPNV